MNTRFRMKRGTRLALCVLALSLGATQVQAQAQPDTLGNRLYDKFQLSVSGSLLSLGSEMRIDGENGSIGSDVDVEDDLGMPRNKIQPRAALRWRPGRKHELEIGYQFARRSGTKELEREIAVGDTTFSAGVRIDTQYDTDNAFLTYRYAFIADDKKLIGAGLGFGAFFFDIGVDALADAGGSESVSYSSGASLVGPTAALGVFGRFRLGEAWYLEPDVRYLRVSVDRITAEVVDASALGKYFFSDKFGVEAGVGIKSVEVDIAPRAEGSIGPKISARMKYTESQARLGVVIPL